MHFVLRYFYSRVESNRLVWFEKQAKSIFIHPQNVHTHAHLPKTAMHLKVEYNRIFTELQHQCSGNLDIFQCIRRWCVNNKKVNSNSITVKIMLDFYNFALWNPEVWRSLDAAPRFEFFQPTFTLFCYLMEQAERRRIGQTYQKWREFQTWALHQSFVFTLGPLVTLVHFNQSLNGS